MPSSNGKTSGRLSEIGRTGLNFGPEGGVEEEFLPNLQGRKAIEAYREMESNDPMVGAILFAIDHLCRSVKWNAEGDDETAEEDTEFLEECMQDMSHSWADFISETMRMVPYGWSFSETVYKVRRGPQRDRAKQASSKFNDGKIGWRKFAPRSQDSLLRWDFDDSGGIQAFVQQAPPTFEIITIPMVKGLLFRTTSSKNSPEGKSVLRNAYRPWYYKKRIEEIEAIGIERDLAGLPVAFVPPEILHEDASPQDKAMAARIQRIVRNIKRDKEEGIVWPLMFDDNNNKLYDLQLLNSGGQRTFDTNQIIVRYDQRIAMTVLADFILLGHDKVGSFALSSDKTDLFAVALGSFLDQIEEVLNRYAIPRLFALNGKDLENLPKITHGDIDQQALSDVATYIQALTAAGMPLFPDDNLEKHFRDLGSFPEKSEDAEPVLPQFNNPLLEGQLPGIPERPASLPPRRVRQRKPLSGSPGARGSDSRRTDDVDLPS